MIAHPVRVTIDDRARLVSAVLAATTWPAIEQDRKRHRAHSHARNTARRVQDHATHPAVCTLQALLDQGTPLEMIYAFALTLSWPDLTPAAYPPAVPTYWTEQLRDFMAQTGLTTWWDEERDTWQLAQEQTQKIVSAIDFYGFFEPFFGAIDEQLILMPNISYPSDGEIGVQSNGALFCMVPPRIAWGDNEPWPFDEDAAHVVRGAVSQYARLLMDGYLRKKAAVIAPNTATPLPVSDDFRRKYPTWGDQLTALFVAGTVAIFLEQTIGQPEAKAYILMEKKVNGLKLLPGVVNILKRYIVEHEHGQYAELADYLPSFGKTLRVVKRAISH